MTHRNDLLTILSLKGAKVELLKDASDAELEGLVQGIKKLESLYPRAFSEGI